MPAGDGKPETVDILYDSEDNLESAKAFADERDPNGKGVTKKFLKGSGR